MLKFTLIISTAALITLSSCASSSGTALGENCRPTYSQVYQPPLKLGGAGRVVNIPSGQKCAPKPPQSSYKLSETKLDINQKVQPWARQANFTSTPPGGMVALGYGENILADDYQPASACKTPCSLVIDTRKNAIIMGEVSIGSSDKSTVVFLPAFVPRRESEGIKIHFSRTSPIHVNYTPLSAGTVSLETGAVYDKDALPLVHVLPLMPWQARRGGSCTVKFDVTPKGIPMNLTTQSCANEIFIAPSLRSVAQWKFVPRKKDGRPVGIVGVETKLTYKLVGKDGKLVP